MQWDLFVRKWRRRRAEARRQKFLPCSEWNLAFASCPQSSWRFCLDDEHCEVTAADFPGSARVSRVGFGVSPKQSLEKSAITRRHRQHVRRVRYPELPLPRVSLPADAIFFVNTSSVPRRRKI